MLEPWRAPLRSAICQQLHVPTPVGESDHRPRPSEGRSTQGGRRACTPAGTDDSGCRRASEERGLPGGLASFLRAPLDGIARPGSMLAIASRRPGGRHSRPLSKRRQEASVRHVRLPDDWRREGMGDVARSTAKSSRSSALRRTDRASTCRGAIRRAGLRGGQHRIAGRPFRSTSASSWTRTTADDVLHLASRRARTETLLTYAGTIRDELVPEAEISTWDVGEIWRGAMPGPVRNVETIWTEQRCRPGVRRPEVRDSRSMTDRESDYCLITVVVSNDADDQRCHHARRRGRRSGTADLHLSCRQRGRLLLSRQRRDGLVLTSAWRCWTPSSSRQANAAAAPRRVRRRTRRVPSRH